jgi:hypothetical protein
MAVTLRPTAELVAQAWLATIPGITSSMVATVLPSKSTGWASTGFVVVAAAGGNSEVYVPVHRSLVQVDAVCFAADSQRPPWGRVDQLAQIIADACYGDTSDGAQLTLTAGPSTGRAALLGAWLSSEPQRLYGDDASLARKRLDVMLAWKP